MKHIAEWIFISAMLFLAALAVYLLVSAMKRVSPPEPVRSFGTIPGQPS
jgi:hypothetical protein